MLHLGVSVPSKQQQPHVVKSGDSLTISIPNTAMSIEISEGQLELSMVGILFINHGLFSLLQMLFLILTSINIYEYIISVRVG